MKLIDEEAMRFYVSDTGAVLNRLILSQNAG
jgi:hypothetical protein